MANRLVLKGSLGDSRAAAQDGLCAEDSSDRVEEAGATFESASDTVDSTFEMLEVEEQAHIAAGEQIPNPTEAQIWFEVAVPAGSDSKAVEEELPWSVGTRTGSVEAEAAERAVVESVAVRTGM